MEKSCTIRNNDVNLQHLKSNFYSYYFFLGHLRCDNEVLFYFPSADRKIIRNCLTKSLQKNIARTLSFCFIVISYRPGVWFHVPNRYDYSSGSARKPLPRISLLSMMLTNAWGSMWYSAERSLIMSERSSVT